MGKKKPQRIIRRKSMRAGTGGAPLKQRKEITGSHEEQGRRDSVSPRAYGGGAEHTYGPGWAGEVVLEGLSADEKTEVLGLVRHTGAKGPRDPNDRVVKIEDTKSGLRILTAENRLALSIGKRVHRSHKGGTLTITWSPGDMPVRVHWKKK
ncbi:MAG TPA: hypothetical protein VL500_03690 [Candidatus Eisenbacteria bacterium]|jgi:hypothetical protein|nr:hypothetical protein [Candidatus Eisenbacteria bacterium]